MRPVCRGPWPIGNDGCRESFQHYRHAKRPLSERIGDYCSYCERTGDLHVEHVIPQSVADELKTDWANFLLACTNCNSTKRDHNQSREGYLWPDQDDTFSAFSYQSGGRVSVADGLEPGEHRRADALFKLVGLGASDTHSNRRRHKRRRAWDKAIELQGKVKGIIYLTTHRTIGSGYE